MGTAPFHFKANSKEYVLDYVEFLPPRNIELVYKRSNTFWTRIWSSWYSQTRANYEVIFDENRSTISLKNVFSKDFRYNSFVQIPGFQENLDATISSCTNFK